LNVTHIAPSLTYIMSYGIYDKTFTTAYLEWLVIEMGECKDPRQDWLNRMVKYREEPYRLLIEEFKCNNDLLEWASVMRARQRENVINDFITLPLNNPRLADVICRTVSIVLIL